jgi:hypothetical protein
MKSKLAAAVCAGFGVIGIVLAQAPGGGFAAQMRAALEEPFIGLTDGRNKRKGLYQIAPTGASTAAVRDAADAFLAALSSEQRARTLFPVDDSEWRNWANVHRFPRQGVSMAELSQSQREAAYDLLQASLSERGYQTSRDIMRLNHHLAELVDNFDEYGEFLYYFTLMGEPSATEPWGWQYDGHHLVINYFVLGDQVVMTPTFMGSEPIVATSGDYAGTSIMDQEQDRALAFMQSLDAAQRATAVVSAAKGRGENQAQMMSDNVVVVPSGLRATALNPEQRRLLLALIEAYVGQMDGPHAALRMDEIAAHLDETRFAWKGEIEDDAIFHYRIQSPVLYIEFDHQGPTALGGPRDLATRNHIHSVIRTPNGNDYGKDLLRQHYEAYADDANHGHQTSGPFAAR